MKNSILNTSRPRTTLGEILVTDVNPLSDKEKKAMKKFFIIWATLFLTIVLLIFTGNLAFGVLLCVFFVLMTAYGVIRLEEDVHIFEIFDIGSQEDHLRWREQRIAKKKLESTDIGAVKNPKLRKQVSDRMAEGWTIESIDNSANRVIMFSTKGGNFAGHAVTGFLTGFWTFGAGNIVYNELSKKRNKKRIAVRLEDASAVQDSNNKQSEAINLLSQLNNLKQDGIITEAEYENKKKQILKNL